MKFNFILTTSNSCYNNSIYNTFYAVINTNSGAKFQISTKNSKFILKTIKNLNEIKMLPEMLELNVFHYNLISRKFNIRCSLSNDATTSIA